MKTIIKKIKDNRAIILKFAVMLAVILAISVITMSILFATGLLEYGEDGFQFDVHMFDSFKDKWYSLPIFILIQTVLTMLLCAIPGVAMAFVMLSTVIYSDNIWMAFLLSYSCVLVSSTVLYVLGRLGGYKLCEKMLGKEDCEKSLELLRTRGTVYFPIMMLFPIFPDDALVMIAGTTRMKLSWFIPSIIICRGIGIATIIFGLDIIPFRSFNLYGWIVFITAAVFWLKEIFSLANKIDRYFEKQRNKPESERAKFSFKKQVKAYLATLALLISIGVSFIPMETVDTLYDQLVIITVSFYWIREIIMLAYNIIHHIVSRRPGAPVDIAEVVMASSTSVNTCHSIATVIICAGIAIVHFNIFKPVINLITLVTVSFFWIRETFKLANKIDHYFAKKKLTAKAKFQGAVEQTLEESMNIEV